ncbi:hypothetical protein CHS0354_023367 [Potamilus streckersoni]|uniref:Octanoyl-[acyl-carrier-protein]:protein N-octanoyltransferase LIPT2, mitochondrial n=1 Tax=Potamilus streckersoni TaxID=2493646 RepID=A0AAE0T5A3_9BIVA|nr:hypothetical protein CHS0354_023367 [Potamilus streckersoni]
MVTTSRLVQVINLHRMGFMPAFDIQTQHARNLLDYVAGRTSHKSPNVLLLVEHNPVYTVGIRDKNYSKEEEIKLKSLGAEFYRTNRGGLITFHGPGQLVAYPVIHLKDFQYGVRDYVCSLEKTMIRTCGHFGLKARTTENVGTWIGDKKIGAIGIHGSRFVTTHGISLNCNVNLDWFKHIVPCGLEGKEVTSLDKELKKNVTVEQTIPFFLESFQDKFQCELDFKMLEEHDYTIIPTEKNLSRIKENLAINASTSIFTESACHS